MANNAASAELLLMCADSPWLSKALQPRALSTLKPQGSSPTAIQKTTWWMSRLLCRADAGGQRTIPSSFLWQMAITGGTVNPQAHKAPCPQTGDGFPGCKLPNQAPDLPWTYCTERWLLLKGRSYRAQHGIRIKPYNIFGTSTGNSSKYTIC